MDFKAFLKEQLERIDKMPPEKRDKALSKLAEVKAERLRLQRDGKIWIYSPQPQQRGFDNSSSKIQFALGGNRSGKSEGGGMTVARTAATSAVVVSVPARLKDSVQAVTTNSAAGLSMTLRPIISYLLI